MNNSYADIISSDYTISVRNYFVLFLLWPFLAFLVAVRNFSHNEAKKVVYMFLIYYGFTFINNNPAVDAYRYALSLKENAQLPFSEFFNIVGGIYSTDTSVDIVEPLISFLVSRITDHHSIYFAVWAAIFGFFYLKSIALLHERYRKNPGWNAFILMFSFIMILPITSISGVRMWTAAWIFFYSAYHVIIYKDPRYLALSFASALFHWSFISANAILLIYFLAGNRNLIYAFLLVLSYLVPGLVQPYLQSISLKLGAGIQTRFTNYSSEGYIMAVRESVEGSVWFMRLSGELVFYYLIIAIVILRLRFWKDIKGKEESNLFSFLLLFLAFVNFGLGIPSFGERFRILFVLFAILYLFIIYIKLPGEKISILILFGLLPMILSSLISLRIGSESINAWIFLPFLGSPVLAPGLSLSEMLF